MLNGTRCVQRDVLQLFSLSIFHALLVSNYPCHIERFIYNSVTCLDEFFVKYTVKLDFRESNFIRSASELFLMNSATIRYYLEVYETVL